jgi:hypothetical protein
MESDCFSRVDQFLVCGLVVVERFPVALGNKLLVTAVEVRGGLVADSAKLFAGASHY